MKIDTFLHISKGGFFISSTKNGLFEDETAKSVISSSKEGFIEDEGRQKTKTAAKKAAESFV